MIIQAIVAAALIGISAPIILDTKMRMDIAAAGQKVNFRSKLRILEMQQALLDENICTLNLSGHPVTSDKNVNAVTYLNSGKDALDQAKRILAPQFLDEAMTQPNDKFDGLNIQNVVLRAPNAAALVGVNAGDPTLAYLEINMLINGVKAQERIPIYVEFDAGGLVNRCSAKRRVRRC